MRISWNDDLIDDLRSWDDLELYLGSEWREVRDGASGLVLTTHFDDLLVDEPPSGTAAQRRLLHKRGFRRKAERCWAWTPPPPSADDLRPPPAAWRGRMAASWKAAERDRALDRARSAQAVRVLREVYACAPADLEVWIVNADGDDVWEDEDDDGAPALDCASLEALYGPGRRALPPSGSAR